MNIKNQPAFPVEVSVDENGNFRGSQTSNFSGFEMGLTKREYFAAMAMQGLVSNLHGTYNPTSLANQCVGLADALLKELSNKL